MLHAIVELPLSIRRSREHPRHLSLDRWKCVRVIVAEFSHCTRCKRMVRGVLLMAWKFDRAEKERQNDARRNDFSQVLLSPGVEAWPLTARSVPVYACPWGRSIHSSREPYCSSARRPTWKRFTCSNGNRFTLLYNFARLYSVAAAAGAPRVCER